MKRANFTQRVLILLLFIFSTGFFNYYLISKIDSNSLPDRLADSKTTVETLNTNSDIDSEQIENNFNIPDSHVYENKSSKKVSANSHNINNKSSIKPIAIEYNNSILEVAAGQLLVDFGNNYNDSSINELAYKYDLYIIRKAKILKSVLFGFSRALNPNSIIKVIKNEKYVASATPNFITKANGENDGVDYSSIDVNKIQWNLQAAGLARDSEFGPSRSVKIAILDTGIAYENYEDGNITYKQAPGFRNIPFWGGYDYINNDEHPNDDNGHGTHITSIIASDSLVRGIAPNVDIIPVKVLDENRVGTEFALVEGIYHAISQGAEVINMSLSFPKGYLPGKLMVNAVNKAAQAGIVMVASSGNDGLAYVSYPAAMPHVIAVGASRIKNKNNKLKRAQYSNFGPTIDIIAPGGTHEYDKNRDGIPDAILGESFEPGNPKEMGYWLFSGTSSAAAHVTAASALLLGEGAESKNILKLICVTADDSFFSGYDIATGCGNLNIFKALSKVSSELPENTKYFVNPVIVLEKSRRGNKVKAIAAVEVVDESGNPVRWAKIWGRWFGDYDKVRASWTNSKGIAVFKSKKVKDGKIFGLELLAVSKFREQAVRPGSFTNIERSSFELLLSLGTGLESSGFGISYAPDALKKYRFFPRRRLLNSIHFKPIGASSGTSPSSVAITNDYLVGSHMGNTTVVLESFGTGLESSGIIFNKNYMSELLKVRSGGEYLKVYQFAMGNGLEFSGFVINNYNIHYNIKDFQYKGLSGVLFMPFGCSVTSSSVVLDVSLWNPQFINLDFNPDLTETNQAEPILFELTRDIAELFGISSDLNDSTASGLESSAIILNFDVNYFIQFSSLFSNSLSVPGFISGIYSSSLEDYNEIEFD